MYVVEKVETTLTVPSIEETAAWYGRVLGWSSHYDTFDAQGHCQFGSVMRGEMASSGGENRAISGFNLSRFGDDAASYSGGQVHFTAFILVDDVDAVYAGVVESGVIPDTAPENQPWGGRTFSMRDLNGFALAFYQYVEQVSLEEIRQRYENIQKKLTIIKSSPFVLKGKETCGHNTQKNRF
ncbi:MAG: VOC family protein, partial [Anaerolineae bacterium]|nr:VOC family protein [Anaerolineae bacterium]